MLLRIITTTTLLSLLIYVSAQIFGFKTDPGINPDSLGNPIAKIAVLSDSHNSLENLQKSLDIAKEKNVDFAIVLGDLSNVGTKSELQQAKKILDQSNLSYYIIPGDHEYYISEWDGSSMIENFKEIFGSRYQKILLDLESFRFKITTSHPAIRLVLLDNASTTAGLDDNQLYWFMDQLTQAKFRGEIVYVFAHNPLYHPTNTRVMGQKSSHLKAQAQTLLKLIRNAPVKIFVGGDQHFSSINQDPKKEGLDHLVVGALSSERNLQSPRFSILTVFDLGGLKIDEVVL